MAFKNYQPEDPGLFEPIGSPEKTQWLRSLPKVYQEILIEDWTANKLIDPSKLPAIVPLETL